MLGYQVSKFPVEIHGQTSRCRGITRGYGDHFLIRGNYCVCAAAVEQPQDSVPSEEEEEEEEEETMVMVEGRPVTLQDVTEDMVARMTSAEKDDYIRLRQELYSMMYE